MTTNTNSLKFYKEMAQVSTYVYKKNEVSLPDGYTFIASSKSISGFYAEAYLKDDILVIAFRGTDFNHINDLYEDMRMATEVLIRQFEFAVRFYDEAIKQYPLKDIKIVVTGHSLGGSLAQYVAFIKKVKAITFNAYGIGKILKGNTQSIDCTSFGNINDMVFYLNIDNQIGNNYVIDTNPNEQMARFSLYHKIQNMGDLENAVPYNPLIHKKFGDITVTDVLKYEKDLLADSVKENLTNTLSKAKSYAKQSVTWVRDTVIRPTFKLLYNDYDVTEEFLPYDYKNILQFIWNVSGEIEKVA